MSSAGRPDAPVLLITKLHPPSVPAQTIVRERLFERLRDGRGLKLSLVACPAGFGKSTLLAAWGEAEGRERPVAWVTLDDGDGDAVVLWPHVIEALGRACPALAEAMPAEIVPPRRCSIPEAGGELARGGGRVSPRGNAPRRMTRPGASEKLARMNYELVLRGEIGDRFGSAVRGDEARATPGHTVLQGAVVDQAHLHGLIERIQELGIELVSVNPLPRKGPE